MSVVLEFFGVFKIFSLCVVCENVLIVFVFGLKFFGVGGVLNLNIDSCNFIVCCKVRVVLFVLN